MVTTEHDDEHCWQQKRKKIIRLKVRESGPSLWKMEMLEMTIDNIAENNTKFNN